MKVEIICTGDEVLSGKIINSNFAHMSGKLEEAGLNVIWGTTVGDNKEDLLKSFHLASERADAVIVNGGLGPTVDDLSQEVAAIASGNELELRQEWLEIMEKFSLLKNFLSLIFNASLNIILSEILFFLYISLKSSSTSTPKNFLG